MVFDGNGIGKRSKAVASYKINLDLDTLNILCRYIIQDVRLIRVEHLVNIKKLLYILDMSVYENDPDRMRRLNFLSKALEARLDNNLTDRDLIFNHINGGIDFKIDFIDYDNIDMDKSNVQYCHKMVEELLEYSFFYNEVDNLQDLITQFKTADISKKGYLARLTEKTLDRIKNQFRKVHVEDNINDVTFSLEEGTFESAVTDTYNMITNPSRMLYTGMQGFNEMIGGGFESGRVYMLLGVAGVGKSLTLLNLINQIKKYNTRVKPKDPTKTPCIVLLTMENTVVETITRLFDLVITNSNGMGNYDLNDVLYKLRNEGGMSITPSSPLDIVIRYKPNRSISTDYLYTLWDDLADIGKEPVIVIQDHIKRIRSTDYNQDLRLELGDIVNEFKVFAAEKDIPVVTVSHLNREATRILEEATRKGNQDSGKLLGKSNTGESLLMIDNLDCGLTIAKDWDKDGTMYMTFHRIKMRGKGSLRDYIAQPFLPDNTIRLVEDVGGIPQFKESIHGVPSLPMTSPNIKADGIASISNIATENDIIDNAFAKSTFNLVPIGANDDNPEFMSQMEGFDNELSNLIIENSKHMEELNNPQPVQYIDPIVFTEEVKEYVCPIVFM